MSNMEQKLINARSEMSNDNEAFIARTMKAAKRAKRRETFMRYVRTTSANNDKEHFMTKLARIPKLTGAVAGIAVVALSGGITYGVFNWFGTSTSIKEQENTTSLVAADCPPSLVQALKEDSQIKYTNASNYKILKPDLISSNDIEQDGLATCEQRAIEDTVRKANAGIYDSRDHSNGLYYPVGRYGKVVKTKGNQITVSNVRIDHQHGPSELTTAVLKINPSTLLTDKGEAANMATFKPGDDVYFIFQNPVADTQDNNDQRATPYGQSTVRAFAKTQYDHAAIKEKMRAAAAENAYKVIDSSDAYGG